MKLSKRKNNIIFYEKIKSKRKFFFCLYLEKKKIYQIIITICTDVCITRPICLRVNI